MRSRYYFPLLLAAGATLAVVVYDWRRRRAYESTLSEPLEPQFGRAARNTLFENSPDGLILLNQRHLVLDINPTAAAILDLSAEEAIGRPLRELVPVKRPRLSRGLSALFPGLDIHREVGGRLRHYQFSSLPVEAEALTPGSQLVLFRDVTDFKRAGVAEQATRQMAEEQANAIRQALDREQQLHEITRLLNSSMDIQSILDNVARLSIELVDAGAATLGLLEEPDGNLAFRHYFAPGRTGPDFEIGRDRSASLFLKILESPEGLSLAESRHLPPRLASHGATALLAAPLVAGDRKLGLLCLYKMEGAKEFDHRDLPALVSIGRQAGIAVQNARLFAEVQQLATTDPLTGIANRRRFFEIAAHELEGARRYGRQLSFIMLDIDHFKNVNDTHGHAVGDFVLQAIAAQCHKSLRRADLLCRYGGEEFAFLLPETGLADAHQIAERIRSTIETTPIETPAGPVSVTVSLGLAALDPGQECEIDQLLDQADQAMYAAKQAGRNRILLWEELPNYPPSAQSLSLT